MSENVFLIDEFIANEIEKGNISKEQFTKEKRDNQTAWALPAKSIVICCSFSKLLSFPENYSVETIPSGCCGMAGSFGYEKEHYDLSMKIGELVLFPAVRKQADEVIIAAPGTSCRHQVKDGTGRKALASGGSIVGSVGLNSNCTHMTQIRKDELQIFILNSYE